MAISISRGSIPLYLQIKDLLVTQITEGKWAPGDIIPSDYAMLVHFMDADALPYVEVEMESASTNDGILGPAKLNRFEVIT